VPVPRVPGKKPGVSYKLANGIVYPGGLHLTDAIVEKDACSFGEGVRQKAESRGFRESQSQALGASRLAASRSFCALKARLLTGSSLGPPAGWAI